MTKPKEHMKFDAKIGKLLNLMVHSIYTNKDIFLRELISNAVDAMEKRRFLAVSDEKIASPTGYEISVTINAEDKTITIKDNGIGMDRKDMISNLGMIANSGTEDFMKNLDSKEEGKESHSKSAQESLIGQFGVGFYSSFMVASQVVVHSRKIETDDTFVWSSNGEDGYDIKASNEYHDIGTSITLHIKDEFDTYLDKHKVKYLIDTYSSGVGFPITIFEGEEIIKISNDTALWQRDKNTITADEYRNFYKSISHLPDSPFLTMHYKLEGNVEFKALLFIPSMKPYDLFHPDRMTRVKLYVKRVFINETELDIIPKYLRFVQGVVDSNYLPLNISREVLQNSATMTKISELVVKKVFGELKHASEDESKQDEYMKFWNDFGQVLKEGLCEASPHRTDILHLCRFYTTKSKDKPISLKEYISRMGDKKALYYCIGENIEDMMSNPQMESFIANDTEVLLFVDHVDGFWTSVVASYEDIEFKSIIRADVEAPEGDADKSNKNKKDADKDDESVDENGVNQNKLIKLFSEVLKGKVKEVKVSHKLVESPSCLTVKAGSMDIRTERFLIEQNQLKNASLKILEINPKNKIVLEAFALLQSEDGSEDKTSGENLVSIIHDMACIAQGEAIKNPASFIKKINAVLQKK